MGFSRMASRQAGEKPLGLGDATQLFLKVGQESAQRTGKQNELRVHTGKGIILVVGIIVHTDKTKFGYHAVLIQYATHDVVVFNGEMGELHTVGNMIAYRRVA